MTAYAVYSAETVEDLEDMKGASISILALGVFCTPQPVQFAQGLCHDKSLDWNGALSLKTCPQRKNKAKMTKHR